MLNERRHKGRNDWRMANPTGQREFHQQLGEAGASPKDENPSRQEQRQTPAVSMGAMHGNAPVKMRKLRMNGGLELPNWLELLQG